LSQSLKSTLKQLSFTKTYLDVYNITLFVDAHVGGQRDWTCCGIISNIRSNVLYKQVYMLKFSTKYIKHNSSELTMLAEGPSKHIPGPPPLASGVCHDA